MRRPPKLQNISCIILRQDEHRVRSDADIGLTWHTISRFAACEGVVAQLVSEVRAVTLPVAIEPHSPVARSREAQRIAVVTAVSKICNDHDIVARATIFPAMKCNDLIGVVDVMHVDVLATETACLIKPVPA